MSAPSRTDVRLRPYRDEDESAVLKLLDATLGAGPAGRRTPEFFRWKHLENPFGRSYMLLAEEGGRIVGLRAFMRWLFTVDGKEFPAVRAVDTATHPDHQGRGIFSRLTLAALVDLAGDTHMVFNTPNSKSLPGYLKMGWRAVGEVPIRVRIRHPVRFARHRRSLRSTRRPTRPPPPVRADMAVKTFHEAEGLSALLREVDANGTRLATSRSLEYLRWRYGAAPLEYRAIREEAGGVTTGLAIFRVRSRGALWETTLAELLIRRGDVTSGSRLLASVARAADVDHLTCSFPAETTAGRAVRPTTWPAPIGMTLVAKPLREDLTPDPGRLSSWALSLGDLEVF